MESAFRRYVTDAGVVDVPNTVYYRRRIAEGDLIDDLKIIADAEKASLTQAESIVDPATSAKKEASVVVAGDKNAAKGA
ncbi:hypothetical protein BJL96_11705 [Burkholderia cenocepacia]|nr:hypothetical protein [Burkholderia cenocepacia]